MSRSMFWQVQFGAISVLPFTVSPAALSLGKPSREKSAVFFNIVQKAFDPRPPHSFEHYVVNFSEGLLTKCANVCRDNYRQNNT